MLRTRRHLEDQIVDFSRRLHARGWVANHDGNATARLNDGRFLITPTAMSKAAVQREDLLVVDAQGKRLTGRRKAFSELDMHLLCYREREDVCAVLHAHPPNATGLAVAGIPIVTTMLAEAVVSLGAMCPLVPYARPKTPETTLHLLPLLATADAFLLENHGVITVGPDLETAYLRMELVEHLAKIQRIAMQVGRVRELPAADIAVLLEARSQAGLGPQARACVP